MGAALDSVSLTGDDGVRHPGAPISSLVRPARCRVLDTLSPPLPPPPRLAPLHLPFALPGTLSLLCWPHQLFILQCCGHLLREARHVTRPPAPAPSAELNCVQVPRLRWGSCQSLPPPRPRRPDSPPWDLL